MSEGWILLSRQITKHWLWEDEPFDKARAWIDLLFLANWDDVKTVYKGELVTCKRGDVNFSISYLAERWKWDRKTVRKFFALLESDGMVTVNATTHRTTITIVKYDDYQIQGTAKGTTKRITKSQQNPQQSPTIKEIKEIKNNICIYGEHKNVKLSDEELAKLKEMFPDDYQQKIENLSFYMYNKSKSYKDHYLTILNWARRDAQKGKAPAKTNTFNKIESHDYDFDELERLMEGK